jgi:hypothetical protein
MKHVPITTTTTPSKQSRGGTDRLIRVGKIAVPLVVWCDGMAQTVGKGKIYVHPR